MIPMYQSKQFKGLFLNCFQISDDTQNENCLRMVKVLSYYSQLSNDFNG